MSNATEGQTPYFLDISFFELPLELDDMCALMIDDRHLDIE